MIAKIKTGKQFKGLCNYLLSKEKNPQVLSSEGVRHFHPNVMTVDFIHQTKYNDKVMRSVGHDSLSFNKGDRELSNEEMNRIAHDYMERMGYRDTQYVLIRHHDRAHQHCHIVYNRVNNHGECISDKNNHYRANRITDELEVDYSLICTEKKNKSKVQKRESQLEGIEIKRSNFSTPPSSEEIKKERFNYRLHVDKQEQKPKNQLKL